MEKSNCKNCQKSFQISDEDIEFYQTVKVPSPTFCPDCRQQRRLSWRNERTLYKRKCDATGKNIISVFSPDKPFTVYDNDYWYSDKWSALDYGVNFDLNRPFFEQFQELIQKVPQLGRSAVNNQNSDFVNQCGWCKNCYLIFEADYNENCYYSNNIYDSKVSMDMLMCVKCELCYECIDCENCYNFKFSEDCKNCSDSWFLKSCIGCRNCFGCINLRNKEYYFLNKKCSKTEYEKKLNNTNLKTYHYLQKARENFLNFIQKYPHKYLHGTQNENPIGDYLFNTQNCHNCFDINNCQDCKYVFNARNMKKCYDITVFGSIGSTEFCYDSHEIGANVRNIFFSDQIWDGCHDIFYSKLCINSCHDLFGCCGLKHAQYCILNKQYSESEYKILREKIVEHMKNSSAQRESEASGFATAELKNKSFGEFFPAAMSPFTYNETIAINHFPLSKAETITKGYRWKDPDPKEYLKQTYEIPPIIKDVPDMIMDQILACIDCGKNYKIVPEELKFYRRQELPIPLKCHDCRHKDRFKLRNKRNLYERNCQKCGLKLQTTYAPDRPEPIYCEKCYQECVI